MQITHSYLAGRLLCTPLEALYTLLIFILVQEGNISPFQLALLGGAKPISSLIAYHGIAGIIGKPHKYKTALITINCLAALPALLFPWMQNSWYFVISYITFVVGLRAIFPAWNASLKSCLNMQGMVRWQGIAIAIQQSILIFLPLALGILFDYDNTLWRTLFAAGAFLQVAYSGILFCMPSPCTDENEIRLPIPTQSITTEIRQQWKSALEILKKRPEFLSYLHMFFWGGAGLVMMQSVLPVFLKGDLKLSYTTIMLVFSTCKGIALLASSRLWARVMPNMSIFRLNTYVNMLTLAFIGMVLLANLHVQWLFVAYIVYGCMQSGCEFSWNLSGPLFAKDSECCSFSSLNLPVVGVRGFIFPFLGQYLMWICGANGVFALAFTMTALATVYCESLARSEEGRIAVFS